jgi:hypothetical protein
METALLALPFRIVDKLLRTACERECVADARHSMSAFGGKADINEQRSAIRWPVPELTPDR